MKKGDLVIRDKNSSDLAFKKFRVPDFVTAVVVSDPYATVFTQDLTHAGAAVYSQEKIVVDLLADNQIINKCPTELIVRVEQVSNAQGEKSS